MDAGSDIEAMLNRLDPIPEGKVLAGISGGADSMLLLHLLVALRDRSRVLPEAVHINHGWRGEESDGDENFVRNRCTVYGVPCHVYRAPCGIPRSENGAREFRYRCFAECAEKTGIRTVVLAHQQDDQVETFLMRLLRGAGSDGLEAMRPVADRAGLTVLRPMLGFSRGDIRRFLSASGLSWREDSTNDKPLYLRNRIRRKLIPAAEELAPGCVGRIARAAGLIAEDNDALNEQAQSLMKNASGGDWFRREDLAKSPRAVAVRALRQWLRNYSEKFVPGITPDHETTCKLYGLVFDTGCGSVNLPGGLHAVSARRFLFLTGLSQRLPAPSPCMIPETVFGEYALTVARSGDNTGDGIREQEVPVGFTEGCAIRTRRTGDYIYPFGSEARQTLKDYMINRKVERFWRDRIPLMARGQEILWVSGLGAGRLPRLDGSQKTERLIWSGPMPWIEMC